MDIKVRAWDTIQKRMEYDLFHESGDIQVTNINKFFTENDYLIFMLFTGIADSNGVKIYAGDILQNEYGVFEVYWRKEFACWQIKSKDGHIEFLANFLGNHHTDTVIGNIYENPELMNK